MTRVKNIIIELFYHYVIVLLYYIIIILLYYYTIMLLYYYISPRRADSTIHNLRWIRHVFWIPSRKTTRQILARNQKKIGNKLTIF